MKKENYITEINSNTLQTYTEYKINTDNIQSIDDIKFMLKMLNINRTSISVPSNLDVSSFKHLFEKL